MEEGAKKYIINDKRSFRILVYLTRKVRFNPKSIGRHFLFMEYDYCWFWVPKIIKLESEIIISSDGFRGKRLRRNENSFIREYI